MRASSSPRNVTVVIPVERGREWNRARASRLPVGTPYLVAEYDQDGWAQAVNDAVNAAETELVVLSAPDVWFQEGPENTIEFLSELCWDADVTYGPLVQWRDGEPDEVAGVALFCPHRLTRENYLPAVFCVRRQRFLEVGGVTSGLWDLQVRLCRAGARFKNVPEAPAARDEEWVDPSPRPEPTEVVASFYNQATLGTAYWRCLLPSRELPGQTIFNLPGFVPSEGKLNWTNHAGAAVFQFAGDAAHHLFMRQMRDEGIRVLVEVDDDYTHWHSRVMKAAGWKRTIAEAPSMYSVEQHRLTCAEADGVIVTTEYLAKRYRKLNANVFVAPNQIDPSDWPVPVKPDDGKFRVGWFASASHRPDAKLIEPALAWAARQPDVEVVMVGIGVGRDGRSPTFKFPYKYCHWSNDLGVYRRFISELDVGLAPVVATPWAQARSDLKALEYAMAGAMPIVSDRPPYEGCEVPGIVHCPDAKAFLRAVQWAVANRDETRALAAEARDYVLAERTVARNIDRWRDAIAQE